MVFKASRDVVLKPSVLLKYVAGAPLQADINMNVLLSDILWVGASYRTGDALVGLLEFQVNKRLRFGYSYDYTLSDIRDYSSGSHEIMVGYDFGKSLEMKKGPTYF
jgi:type IX secretion system PorP/SprF family membrane protein